MNDSSSIQDEPIADPSLTSDAVAAPEAPAGGTGGPASLPTAERDRLLAEVERLYDLGRYRDALAAAAPLGDLRHWPGTAARVLAGRLASNLGAPRLGRALHWLAGRQDAQHPQAQVFAALAFWSRFGTVRAWWRYRQVELASQADATAKADWLAMKALMLASLRDFARAEPLMIQALETDPQSAWLHVELSELLDRQDLHEESLRAARDALQLRPYFRPAVQAAAHRLVQLRRDDEALDLLTDAAGRLQSGEVWCQLSALQSELKNYDAAWEAIEQAEACWPLASADSHHLKWLAAQRSDLAYFLGRYQEAIELAAGIDRPFYQRLGERLTQALAHPNPPERPPRVQLAVPFTRQLHETCAPATLTSIAQYWNRPVAHEEIVQRICYEGTRANDERRWAEENGFQAREFRVTEATVEALVRAGVPMTLNTVDPGSAHLQGIVGIDVYRGTFLLQDPSERHVAEAASEKLIEHYASTGPRGMLMVPVEEAARVAAVELPDAQLYDEHYIADGALAKFDRPTAQAAVDRMVALAPEHRLTLQCQLALARYDANPAVQLELVERLLQQFPSDANLLLFKCSLLNEFGQRSERIALLREACESETRHPIFWSRLAAELLDDARDQAEAFWQLRKAVRFPQADGRSLSLLGDYHWDRRQREVALEYYRLAASLSDKDETYARRYFLAAHYLHETEAALNWLRDRYRRFDARNSSPGRTLAGSLEHIDRTLEALEVLDEMVRNHPADGDLLCFAALTFGRTNQAQRASECLSAARGKCSPASFARTSAMLAQSQGNLADARDLFLQVLELDPLDIDARGRVLSLDMDLAGAEVAERRLREALADFPHSYSLRVLLIQWLRSNRLSAVDEELDRFLNFHPRDAWGHREAAIAALAAHDLDRAASEVATALELAPNNEVAHFIQGKICEQRGQIEEARRCFRRAIEQNVDYEPATVCLLATCDRPAERAEELEFVFGQLRTQTTYGDGIVGYRDAAQGRVEPARLLEQLLEAREHRPDLWQTWSMVVQQLLAMNQRQRAIEVAREATERFPLLPRMWLDLALVYRKVGDRDAELKALERARSINPHWGDVARELSDLYLDREQFDDAEQAIRQVLAAEPRDPAALGALADCLYRAGKKSEALEPLKTACATAPGYDWAWGQLCQWSHELDQGQSAREAAEKAIAARPHDARCYQRMAEALSEIEEIPQALTFLEQALALDARSVEAHVLKAYYLGRLHRWDDALEACTPPIFGDEVPVILRMRRAYVLYRKGRLDDAIIEMRGALERDPDHYAAWNQLADWADECHKQDVYREAAENMVRIEPHQPAPRGYLADALLATPDGREEAKRQLRLALELSPEYAFGTSRLFELHLADNEIASAREVLELGGAHLPPGFEPSLKMQLLAVEDLKREPVGGAATAFLIQWAGQENAEISALMRAVDNLDARIAHVAIHLLVRAATENPQQAGVGAALGRLIGRVYSSKEGFKTLKRLPDGDAWHAAARAALRSMAGFRKGPSLLEDVTRRFRKRLKSRTESWAAVATTMMDFGQNEAARAWTRDWAAHGDARPLQLVGAVACRWECFRRGEARPIVNHALTLEEDDGTGLIRLWAGLDALLGGDNVAALNHAREISMHQMAQWYVVGYRILVAALEAMPGLVDDAPVRSKSEAQALVRSFSPYQFGVGPEYHRDRLTLWLLRRVAAAVARAHHLSGTAAWKRLEAIWASGRFA